MKKNTRYKLKLIKSKEVKNIQKLKNHIIVNNMEVINKKM